MSKKKKTTIVSRNIKTKVIKIPKGYTLYKKAKIGENKLGLMFRSKKKRRLK